MGQNRCIRKTSFTMEDDKKFYMGFDFSTQQVKVIVVNDSMTSVYEDSVSYDRDLPEFGTKGGVHIHEDKVTITAPTAMFIKALDVVLAKMVSSGFQFERVAAIAGATQIVFVLTSSADPDEMLHYATFHLGLYCLPTYAFMSHKYTNGWKYTSDRQSTSVYLKPGAAEKLQTLDVHNSLYDQLKDIFSIADPPMWMDNTARKQCQELEVALGGPMELALLTGSRALDVNPAPVIRKIFQTQRETYDNTENTALMSNLVASLFLGDYAPLDYSVGSITNLMDINNKCWSPACLDACAIGLASKLPDLVPSHTLLGTVSSFMQKKYKFSKDCKLVAWTGDNAQSMVGMALKENELTITLGTADCFYLRSPTPIVNLYGHALINTLDPDSFVHELGWKNGSLTRQRIMERCAGSWENFNQMLLSTPPGNNGNIGIYFDSTEIMPRVLGTYRFDKHSQQVESFPPDIEVRAVLEGQFIARRLYAERCGLLTHTKASILATGGASANRSILQVISDVFNAAVYTIDVPNSAALGGCYRAKLALLESSEVHTLKGIAEPVCAVAPTPGLGKVYNEMLARYEDSESQEVISDVFSAAVYTIDVPSSAALGGCYRAKLALLESSEVDTLEGIAEPVCAVTPTPGLGKVYDEMLARYENIETQIASKYETV